MTASAPSTVRHPSAAVYGWAFALAAVLIGLLLLDNRAYLFETPLYEHSDWGSNSLFVREAESGAVLHGHYSRWNFYHPGPVLFYTYALGEGVLYNWFHLVPAPYNGQVIAESAAVTLLFSLALAVFAGRLGSRRGGYAFFLPLALTFAVWHYGTGQVAAAFMETWPAWTPVLVFLCFVVAAASVASGSGRELPLAAFCGGWLVHNHVAQPLFVVPMTCLAYGGLIASCRPTTTAGGKPVGRAGSLLAGWRASPRAHLVAAGVLVLFLLPVVGDMLHGDQSNFQRIVEHMRRQHEPMHKLARSFCYFLTFGGYEAYNPSEIFFGKYSAAGMLAFIGRHWQAYGCWLAALVGGPLFLALARRRLAATPPGDEPEPAVAGRRDTFLRWFVVMTATAFALTLFWGMKQDGDMLYFNAYFNFSIYYCIALGLAAGLAVFLRALLARRTRLARGAVSTLLFVTAGWAAIRNADSFKSTTVAGPEGAAIVKATTEAAKASVPPDAVCYLDFDRGGNWGTATGIALQLDRLGYRVRVNDNWGIMFGERHTFSHDPADFDHPVIHWVLLPNALQPPAVGRWPVWPDNSLAVMPIADLSPDGGKIRFAVDGNWVQYAFVGWAQTSDDRTWNDRSNGLVQFRPLPLPADNTAGVDILIDAWSFTTPRAMTPQRVEINFCGTKLPTLSLPLEPPSEPTKVHLSADLWRAACARGFAKVLFHFPDARSPYSLGMNDDTRKLGGAFRSIEFRVAQ